MDDATTPPPILVVEDDPETLLLLRTLLENLGHAVHTAVDGEEALAAFGEVDPDVVLLDWMMPGLSGPEVCRRMRAEPGPSEPYIVLLTAKDGTDALVEGLQAGADEYLVKPVDPAELAARVRVGQRIATLQRRLADRVAELEAALEQVRTLEGLIPICMYCKKVRDTESYWEQVESYVSNRTNVRFSHGVCPDCVPRLEAEWGVDLSSVKERDGA